MKNVIILDKVFKVEKKLNVTYQDSIWNCSYNGKIIASLRIHRKGIYRGNWYLYIFETPWTPIKENKAATVKAMVLDYILTHFNNL